MANMKLRRAASDFLWKDAGFLLSQSLSFELVAVTILVFDLTLVWELGVSGSLTLAHTHADAHTSF
jgi:hypothetical protein